MFAYLWQKCFSLRCFPSFSAALSPAPLSLGSQFLTIKCGKVWLLYCSQPSLPGTPLQTHCTTYSAAYTLPHCHFIEVDKEIFENNIKSKLIKPAWGLQMIITNICKVFGLNKPLIKNLYRCKLTSVSQYKTLIKRKTWFVVSEVPHAKDIWHYSLSEWQLTRQRITCDFYPIGCSPRDCCQGTDLWFRL